MASKFECEMFSAVCLINKSGKKEIKTKSNCASDGSLMLANSLLGVEISNLSWYILITFGEELLFYFFTYLVLYNVVYCSLQV